MRAARGILTATAAVLALALAACAPAEITPATVTVVASPPTDKSFAPEPPEDPMPSIAWPLTGLDASTATPEELARPALSVKVPNDSKARPQSNIEFADIVFEEYVEAGIPRFIAVFHSNVPETVGPVRSMREMDAAIIGSLNGPLIFSGASKPVMDITRRSGQYLIAQDLGHGGFFRTKDKPAPYNLHIDTQDMFDQSGGLTAPGPQFAYAYPADFATASVHGTPASHIQLRFSKYGEPSWDWDEASGTWLRSEFGEPDITMGGNRIAAENVIVLFVKVHLNHGLPVSEMIVTNSPGYVATGGKYIPILWSKSDRTAGYVITMEDGTPVQLAPGKTWVELIPNGGYAVGSADFS